MKAEYHKSIEKTNKIKSPFFRNMLWLVYCDHIVNIEGFNYDFIDTRSFESLIKWISGLNDSIIPQINESIPLGKYAEKLISVYLNHHPKFKLYSSNLQLIENQITLGELDFLFEDLNSHKSIHLEFSIKYYLKTTKENQITFLGLSTKDWMSRKINKLINKQTQLGLTHNYLFPEELQAIKFLPKAIIKGCLFYGWEEWLLKVNRDPLNQGWWIHVDKLKHLDNTESAFTIVHLKKDWIFPFNAEFPKLAFSQLRVFVEDKLKSNNEIMIVRYTKAGIPIDRGFVMRKNWPN